MPPVIDGISLGTKLLVFLLFALLVCNTTAGFASRLARGLALATAALFSAGAKIRCFNRLDVFHFGYLHRIFNMPILSYFSVKCNMYFKFFYFYFVT